MITERVGDGSWADIPGTHLRVYAELEPTGWAFSVFDLNRKVWVVQGQSADDEADARNTAERWVFQAGLLMPGTSLQWQRQ
ncbi:MAG TPA: hypothetical protein VN577_01375 [Terriglobales bacterium]|nr:hypothetical protein [Terriglobales bacterium]